MNNLLRKHGLSTLLPLRLENRLSLMISDHLTTMPKLAQGVKALSHHTTAFSNTQAAWRFLNNEHAIFQEISRPLLQSGFQELSQSTGKYGLVMHDWCRVQYLSHKAKTDQCQLSHKFDVGYDLFASLLLSDSGDVIAPLNLELSCAKGTLVFESDTHQETKSHLNQLVSAAKKLDQIEFGKPLVHIIDREADSATHLREMMQCSWLTRSKGCNTVEHNGESKTLTKIAQSLTTECIDSFSFQGKEAFRFVGETKVKLVRTSEAKKITDAPEVRFVYCVIADESGKELATWYLLSNVTDVPAETLAFWYYKRWEIESWFKVLKGHGFQLEHWQQETSEAIYRRLIVSSMACVLAWKLYQDKSKEAQSFKALLIKFSGRSTKRAKPITFPALLSGLWVYMQINEFMNTYTPDEIEAFMDFGRSFFGRYV